MIELDAWEKRTDARHFAPRLIKLCKKLNIPCEIAALGTGDIRFLTRYLEIVRIERKSTDGDLYTSSSSRLQNQCLRLIDEADIPILLIDGPLMVNKEGYFKAGRYATGWKFSSVTHILLSLQQRGLNIVYVPNKAHTPQEVVDLYEYFQKEDHVSVLQAAEKPFTTSPRGLTEREQKLRVLMSISGVGPEIAKRLYDIYGSVDAVASASQEGIASLPGVGKTKAQKIKDILN